MCLTEILVQLAQRKSWTGSCVVPEMHRGAVKGVCVGGWDTNVLPGSQTSFWLLDLHTLPGAFPACSGPMVAEETVPASLQPLWPASARVLVLPGPSFPVKRVFAKGKSVLCRSQARSHLCWDTRELRAQHAFLGDAEECGCSQRIPCLGTTCLHEQRERWLMSHFKRNSPSIINERVPMEKNIVLITLLDVSKALVIVVSGFQVVCFSSFWKKLIFLLFFCPPIAILSSFPVPSVSYCASCSAAALPCLP